MKKEKRRLRLVIEREKESQVGFRCHEICGVNQESFYF